MPNYKEKQVVGNRYLRSNGVYIRNELGESPSITFSEQEIIFIDGSTPVKRDITSLIEIMSEEKYTTEFPLLNPVTGEQIGTAKYQDIYVMLHSLYYYLADVRDNYVPPVFVDPITLIEQPPVET
jgi:hypothetical protein